MKLSGRVFTNKKNKQMSIVLPKKKLKLVKDGSPKKIYFKIEKIEW